jgi:hypothetical protein
MRAATSKGLAPAQTTRQGNVNVYLCGYPDRSLSGKGFVARVLGAQAEPNVTAPSVGEFGYPVVAGSMN